MAMADVGQSPINEANFTCWDGSIVTHADLCPSKDALIVCPPGPDIQTENLMVSGIINDPITVSISLVVYPYGPTDLIDFFYAVDLGENTSIQTTYRHDELNSVKIVSEPEFSMEKVEDYRVEETPDGFVVSAINGEQEAFYECLVNTLNDHVSGGAFERDLHVTCD